MKRSVSRLRRLALRFVGLTALEGLLIATPLTAHAAIAFHREGHHDLGGATSNPVSITVDAGDTVVVLVSEATSTVQSVADSGPGGNTYTLMASDISGFVKVYVWASLNVAQAATTVTVTFAGAANSTISVVTYTGVDSLGNTKTATGISTNPSITVTTQDINNYIVAALGVNGGAVGSGVSENGTIRLNVYASNQGSTLVTSIDNTSASSGSVTCSYTQASATWTAAAVELRARTNSPTATRSRR